MASDYASAVTGEVTNLTCGALQDWNARLASQAAPRCHKK
jgi:hypothetical protein